MQIYVAKMCCHSGERAPVAVRLCNFSRIGYKLPSRLGLGSIFPVVGDLRSGGAAAVILFWVQVQIESEHYSVSPGGIRFLALDVCYLAESIENETRAGQLPCWEKSLY